MKKILILIFLLIASFSQAQVRRGSFLTISDLDSFQLGGRYFNIASFNDSTEERSNVFTRDNTFNGSVDLNGFTTVYGEIEFNNLIVAKDTVFFSNPNGTGFLRLFSNNSDSLFRLEGSLKGITINPNFTIRNSGASILWNPLSSPTANRTKFTAHDFQSTVTATANNQSLLNMRVRGGWDSAGFSGINRVPFSVEQSTGGVSTFRVLESYNVLFLLDKLGTHSIDYGAGRLVVLQDGDTKSSISFVHDGNPAEGATYDTTDIIDFTIYKSPIKVLYSTGNFGMRYDSTGYYWGFAGDNGTWREHKQGDTLLTQRKEGGAWVTKEYTTSTVSGVNTGFSINTTASAFTVPRMTETQRDALTPVAGDIIFNTTTNKHQGYDGTIWNDFY